MSILPSEDKMRARFHELQATRAAILEAAQPIRDKRDAYVNEAMARERELNAELAEATAGLVEIDRELVGLAKALGGKVGAPPEAA